MYSNMRAAPLLVYPVPCERARSDVFVYRRKRLSPLALVWLVTPVHFIVRSISPLVGGNKLPQLKHMDYCIHGKRKVNSTCKVNF